MSNTPTVTPRGDRVLVDMNYADERVTQGGVILPEATRASPQRGKVLAMGPGRLLDDGTRAPIEGIAVGDIVVVGKHAGSDVELDDMPSGERAPKWQLYREVDVLAVVAHG